MSGFESAIRNALVRSSSGTSESRQRVYAAARASLERNLSRVNADATTATEQRQRLEATIDGIEGEWSGRPKPTADRPSRAVPSPTPPVASAPPVADAPPVAEPDIVEPIRAGPEGAPPTAPPPPHPGDETEVPSFPRSSSPRPSNEARLEEPPPDEVTVPRVTRDPFFAEGAATDDPEPIAAPEPVATVEPDPAPDAPVIAVDRERSEPKRSFGRRTEPVMVAEPGVDAGTATAEPEVSIGEQTPRGSARRDRKMERKRQNAAEKRKRKEVRRKRRPFRLVALALVLIAAVAAYWWVQEEGLLEARQGSVAPITTVDGLGGADDAITEQDWVEVLDPVAEGATGSVELVESGDASMLRIDGSATLQLEQSALGGMGDRVRLAVSLRASGDGLAVAFNCSGALECGRKRFIAPREMGELLFEADVSQAGVPEILVDPRIEGGRGSVEIMAVRATAI